MHNTITFTKYKWYTTHTYKSVSFSRAIIRYICSCHTVQIHSEFCCTPPPGCSALWDGLNCWPHAEVGETVSWPCPSFLRVKGVVHLGFSQTSVPEFNSIKPVKKKEKKKAEIILSKNKLFWNGRVIWNFKTKFKTTKFACVFYVLGNDFYDSYSV